jgi:hypothetical protein
MSNINDKNKVLLRQFLLGATIVSFEEYDSGLALQSLTLKGINGEEIYLYKVNHPSWSSSSEGWIDISIDGESFDEICKGG